MKRILIIGNSPLPNENTESRPAAGLRTYQFLKPLVQEGGIVVTSAEQAFSAKRQTGFNVTLITIAMPECYKEDPGRKEIKYSENFSHYSISKNDSDLISFIQQIHDEFHPDAILSINTYPSYIASQINSRAPMWADLNGWIMAEAQAQASKVGNNNYLSHYYNMEMTVLSRADKFSAVSTPQKYALLGELASMGRLNNESFGYKFTYDIANGTEWFENEKLGTGEEERAEIDKKVKEIFGGASGVKVPKNAFVLLWMGGYNTWVDEKTLFRGVEEAMSKCEKLYFVSTGGDIKGLDNKTFASFKKMIDGSKYKDRYVFLGWVDTADIPYIYDRADVGLNVDRKCVETYTGARNRINEMMKFGLPVITTLGSEISYEVVRTGSGIGVKSGRYEDLSDSILNMYGDWKDRHGYKLKEFGKNGQKYIQKECNYEFLLKPLLKWLENPRPAPDRHVDVHLGGGGGLSGMARSGLQYLKDNGIKKFFSKAVQKGKGILKRK